MNISEDMLKEMSINYGIPYRDLVSLVEIGEAISNEWVMTQKEVMTRIYEFISKYPPPNGRLMAACAILGSIFFLIEGKVEREEVLKFLSILNKLST